MAEAKTQKTTVSVTAFLDGVADPARQADCRRVATMMKKVTGEKPTMWGASIVGFGTYRYQYESGKTGDWPITGFSPRKQELTLYIMPGFERYASLLEQLGKHRHGKSCLYIKRLSDIDFDVLTELVTESVAAMESKRVRA
ncbi:MAG: DUF1801 domain-containing protein [Gemmatimonadetes bacterium]|nr:DUF1801 domain-containing protein [Gemmatimonadota bacterium]MCC6771517.1 DUF1801 domain-containing protein [Gemmatimonadaceae bacterium]